MTDDDLAVTAGIKSDSGKKNLTVRAVIVLDDQGNYFIHGMSREDPETMFKTMHPLWNVNPATEIVRFIEFNLVVPEIISQPKIRIQNID